MRNFEVTYRRSSGRNRRRSFVARIPGELPRRVFEDGIRREKRYRTKLVACIVVSIPRCISCVDSLTCFVARPNVPLISVKVVLKYYHFPREPPYRRNSSVAKIFWMRERDGVPRLFRSTIAGVYEERSRSRVMSYLY